MRKNFNLFGIEINLIIFEREGVRISEHDKLIEILKEIKGKQLDIYIDKINYSLNHKIEKDWIFQFEDEELSIGYTFKIDTDEIEKIELYKEYSSEVNNHSTFRVIMKTNDELYFYAHDNLE